MELSLSAAAVAGAQACAELKKLEFTSKQVESLLTATEMKRSGLVEASMYELRQLELAIYKRERALAEKRKKIRSLGKRQAALRANRADYAPKPGKERTKRFLKAQWLADTMQLRLRLTDKVAHRLMDERCVPRSGTQQKFMPMRME
ncbi:MAG: hypothetical protein NVS2B4_01990 [Ramlibacter sp.]